MPGLALIMSIRIIQLGTPRKAGEGLRLGTVRRPPRGVPKSDFARLDYYDVWFPNLSPSAELVQEGVQLLKSPAIMTLLASSNRAEKRTSSPSCLTP